MSVVIKPKRFKRLPAATPALWVVLGLAVTFFLVRFGQEVLMEHELNNKIVVQRSSNSNLADENARLQAALQYYQSDKYVEQRAREDLGLRRADEEVLIPIGDSPQASTGTPSTPTSTGGDQSSPPAPTAGEPNWQQWFELFNPFAASP